MSLDLASTHLDQAIAALREVRPRSRAHRTALAAALSSLYAARDSLETAAKADATADFAHVYPPNPPGWYPGKPA